MAQAFKRINVHIAAIVACSRRPSEYLLVRHEPSAERTAGRGEILGGNQFEAVTLPLRLRADESVDLRVLGSKVAQCVGAIELIDAFGWCASTRDPHAAEEGRGRWQRKGAARCSARDGRETLCHERPAGGEIQVEVGRLANLLERPLYRAADVARAEKLALEGVEAIRVGQRGVKGGQLRHYIDLSRRLSHSLRVGNAIAIGELGRANSQVERSCCEHGIEELLQLWNLARHALAVTRWRGLRVPSPLGELES